MTTNCSYSDTNIAAAVTETTTAATIATSATIVVAAATPITTATVTPTAAVTSITATGTAVAVETAVASTSSRTVSIYTKQILYSLFFLIVNINVILRNVMQAY
ncbi:unnamed protein product [Meganyctiphanes norvegica]|uniref:Uncharacterized protein n=1 Tax=Meganyctiphanes norvegica TaxID=48144 RepID=A0AAV2RDD4_MEGNR